MASLTASDQACFFAELSSSVEVVLEDNDDEEEDDDNEETEELDESLAAVAASKSEGCGSKPVGNRYVMSPLEG